MATLRSKFTTTEALFYAFALPCEALAWSKLQLLFVLLMSSMCNVYRHKFGDLFEMFDDPKHSNLNVLAFTRG